jgi:glutamate-1-semialdehyde 2,1-aminomutase
MMLQKNNKPYAYTKSLNLFARAANVIPEGIYGHQNPAFVLPGACPYFAERAEGGHFWDVDGNEYIDFQCGYGPVILGHNHPEVDEAVQEQNKKGSCFSHPTKLMVELAERLTSLISIADWAAFAKNGSDVTTWAIRIAREYTGGEKIIMAKGAYHGAHAWCTAYPGGVLADERKHILSMTWNRLDELEKLAHEHKGQIAGVILTPYHHPTYAAQEMPANGFWEGVRHICDREGIVLILDDIRACFRLDVHGSHQFFNIDPDIICVAKAMANGHPISAALGRNRLRESAEAVFFAGTFWSSPAPMAAALKTLTILETTDAIPKMARLGNRLKTGLKQLGQKHGFNVTVSGPPALPYLTFDDDPDLYHIQAFCRHMISRGIFLHPHHNWFICAAHTDEDIDYTLEIAKEVFPEVLREMGE